MSTGGSINSPMPLPREKVSWTRVVCRTQWGDQKGTQSESRGRVHSGCEETHTRITSDVPQTFQSSTSGKGLALDRVCFIAPEHAEVLHRHRQEVVRSTGPSEKMFLHYKYHHLR